MHQHYESLTFRAAQMFRCGASDSERYNVQPGTGNAVGRAGDAVPLHECTCSAEGAECTLVTRGSEGACTTAPKPWRSAWSRVGKQSGGCALWGEGAQRPEPHRAVPTPAGGGGGGRRARAGVVPP